MDKRPLLNVKSLKEQVYEYLREQMRKGGLGPGSTIDMEETSKRLGVSKTPLRDALLLLETEGFVSVLPRRKVVVNPLTLQDIQDYYEILGALEATALGASFGRLGPAEIAHMEALNAAMRRAIDGDDFDLYYEKNLAFHDVFLGLSGNDYLKKTVNTLKKRLYDFPRREGFVKEWEQSSIGEHTGLLEAIRRGDREAAVEQIRGVHWSYAVQEKFLVRYYAQAAVAG
jgi:DNA-binding GntR family transcriptional regulator